MNTLKLDSSGVCQCGNCRDRRKSVAHLSNDELADLIYARFVLLIVLGAGIPLVAIAASILFTLAAAPALGVSR